MTWTATSCDNLKYALPIGGTTLELASATGTTDLCALIGDPAVRHVVLEVYTASGSETVVAYGCKNGAVQITRANAGSTQKAWPVGACVRTVQIIEGALCGTEIDGGDEDGCCTAASIWGGVTVCPEITLDLSIPDAPSLCLTPSGVVAGERCGGRFRVDEFGRITYMAADFPQACLPVFDPCACGDTGTGSGTTPTASEVMYSGGAGCLLTSGSVQQALLALEGYVCSITPSGGGVVGVGEGNGIDITGGPSNPVINLASLGIAGTYGGFTVNDYGQITGYSAPPAGALPLGANAPLSVAQNALGTYVYSVGTASETNLGVVQLASSGDFAVNTPIPSDRVISWGFLQLWWDRVKNFICDLTNVPELTALERADAKIPVCVGGTTVSVSPAELVAGGGGAFARVYADNTTVVSSDNVVSIMITASGYLVTMQSPAPTGYHVYASNYSGALLIPAITKVNTTQFYVAWYDTGGVQYLGALPWSAAVFRGEP